LILCFLARYSAASVGHEAVVVLLREDPHDLVAVLLAALAVGRSSAQAVHHRLVALALQLFEQSPYLPFAALQLLGRLPLGNLPLVCLFEHHPPVSISLCHGENSVVFHLPSLTLSIGHF